MDRKEIAASVKAALGEKITVKDSETAVGIVLQSITEGLVKDKEVQLIGFGTFKVKDVPERKGHNPQTGKELVIPAHKRVVFKAGKAVTEKVQ